MGKVKAKGGAMYAASQQINNPDGPELTGDAARAVATRAANANANAAVTPEGEFFGRPSPEARLEYYNAGLSSTNARALEFPM
jgi:hypothetical protein